MNTVIALPSAAGRSHLAIYRSLAAYIESVTGIEEMMRLALEHAESVARHRATRRLAEVLNVMVS